MNRKTFYNATLDLTIQFLGNEFVIIGDSNKVTLQVLFALHQGKLPEGWIQVEDQA